MQVNYIPAHGGAVTFGAREPSVVHPDFQYWAPVWARIRDCEIGEVEIKHQAQKYLPKLAGHDWEQYASYLHRATFYNASARTLAATYGGMFVHKPKVTGFTAPARFSKCGMSLNLTAKTVGREVTAVGRYGVLVDSPVSGGAAFACGYTAENILDWATSEGQLTNVILRESTVTRDSTGKAVIAARYRVLALEPSTNGWTYTVYVFEDKTGAGPDLAALPDEIYIPTIRGRSLDYIPFQFFGAFSNTPDVQKPPLLDVVTLNLSHYQSYAALEQARFYTANPVYTVSGGNATDESGEYYVGPDMVWVLPKDGTASVLEYKGQGLRSLESALDQKEAAMASIGAKLISPDHSGTGESDAALLRKEQAERAIVDTIADALDEGFANVLRWFADFSNKPTEGIEFEVSRDWLARRKNTDPRALRAAHQMYADGVIPLPVFYEFLVKADVIPEWLGYEEYQEMLSDPEEFPNQLNVIAKMQGFPDARSWHEYRLKTGELV